MKRHCMPRLSQRNLLIFGLVCLIGFYILTLLRIESHIRNHNQNTLHLISLVETANIAQIRYEENTVRPARIVKEILYKTDPQKPDKLCKIKRHQFFPLCEEKLQYMRQMWEADCFQKYHSVINNDCSFIHYLQEVEPFCAGDSSGRKTVIEYAKPRFDLDGFLKLMPGKLFSWMKQRAKLLWDDWVIAGKKFMKLKQRWKKKKVIALMGSMGFQPHLLTRAGHGGPLGELIQWTDLICGLYILGYDVKVALNATELSFLDKDTSNSCAARPGARNVDIIYTDLNGVTLIHMFAGFASSAKYRCMYRSLDSFGTYPEFNYPAYPHKIIGGRSSWADLNLIPTQFMTLYPHTHDNYFLGFVVGSSKDNNADDDLNKLNRKKKDKALIYAKKAYYFNGNKETIAYLKIISEYFELHATAVDGDVPSFITNHGSVTPSKIKQLMQESKLFVGVGFPFEGPGPIEAMAAGTAYLQPKYDEPKNKLNDNFFDGKPTLRLLTSQSPYMEEFVGEPYCYTIDIKDEKLLRKTLEKVKTSEPLPPKIPKEFTNEGMLERIHVFTEHMNYCDANAPRWPPIENLQVVVTNLGQSCKDACMAKGLVCERTYFDDINLKEVIERYSEISCKLTKSVMHLHPPSYDPVSNICFLQENVQLYSCMHIEEKYRMICPCRDYELEQEALCKDCL